MAVKVNIEQLREFEKPLLKSNEAFLDVLHALKDCREAIGEGTGIEEAIERDGQALEKAFNEEVLAGVQTVLNTLAASADNAEEIQKVMASFEAVNTSAISDVTVEQGVKPAAFGRR